jgi:diguanylate cyclase (GGDEF)-like protein
MSAAPDMPDAGETRNAHGAHNSNALVSSHTFTMKLAEMSSGNVEQFIVDTLAQAVHAEQVSLALYEEREGYMAIAATRGYPAELVSDLRVKEGEGLMGEVLSSRLPKVVTDVTEEPRAGRRRLRYRTSSCLLVPLVAGDRLLAVLNLADRADGQAFDSQDLAKVRSFVAPATLALLAGRLAKDKADLALLVATDPLTGLFNRRHFTTRLEEEIARAHRDRSNLTVLAVDVDLFKSVNDRFGHAAGDAVLRAVAHVIKGAIRFFDVCARMGGDEFVILLRGSEASALQTAERLRKRIAEWRPEPELDLHADLTVTVSVGLASLAPETTSAQDLLMRADRALYAAKVGGRNRVGIEHGPSQPRQD